MKKFYMGKDEFRLNKLTSMGGHYLLFKNRESADREAKKRANHDNVPWLVQKWKPRKGKIIDIVRPTKMKLLSKKTLISMYKDMGYNIKYIKPPNFRITKL